MAEAVAIIGLVSSIASLIDASAKVVSRLHGFTSKSSDIPELFRSFLVQLPLLTATLRHIQTQAQEGSLPDDATTALQAVVSSTSTEVSVIQKCLSDILPPQGVSKLERGLKALKSLAKEDKVCQASEKIHKSIDILVLHQTTRHVDMGTHILQELSKLSVAPRGSSESFGICLGQAPQIEPDAFIGRTDELQQLRAWLSPANHPNRQCVVSIIGVGGIGKTQLSLAHVWDCCCYSSVFWVNAKDEKILRQGMADLSTVIFHESTDLSARSADDVKRKIDEVLRWLSKPGNDQWLLIFDNYDDPYLPGVRSATGYDIRSFFPTRSQGNIIITSRSTKLTFSKQLKLGKLENIHTSVAILSQRSGRDLSRDSDALDLARRLDGLPLALATAGTYLGRADISCNEYIEFYNSAWMDLVGMEELLEYEARTMSSTWTLSLDQVRRQDRDASELLTFLAYLGNRDIWYELIQAGANDDVPWMRRVTKTKIHFQRAMSKLHDYNLVDVAAGSYLVHPCLHDWLVEGLNTPPKPELFLTALACVTCSVDDESGPRFWVTSRRLLEHAEQLESPRFHTLWQRMASEKRVIDAAHIIAGVHRQWDRHDKAEQMYIRALAGGEKALGPDHTLTLSTVHNLGALYRDRGKLEVAEPMCIRALEGYEKSLGCDHTSTLSTIHNLGNLYRDQGKLEAAEQMYMRALAGREKALGLDHPSTLSTVHNLGALYRDQGKLEVAEQMYMRALAGGEKVLGPDHTLTLSTVHNLGVLYRDQGKLEVAEPMCIRALEGYEKSLGRDHTSTLGAVHNLGLLYADLEKLEAAEQMYMRALEGYEKSLGRDHTLTLSTIHNLALLYTDQGKLEAAEQMYMRALAGREKVLGPEHSLTLSTVHCLGALFTDQGKLEAAEQMYMRALAGREKALGPDHALTLNTAHSLGALYTDQGKLEAAQQIYTHALFVYQNIFRANKPPSPLAIRVFAAVLCKSMRMADLDQFVWQSNTACLIQLAEYWGMKDADIIDWLGRSMVYLKDDKNAQLAFRHSIECRGGGLADFGRVRCNSCIRKITISSGRHVCRQCVDIDLCDSCMSKYAVKVLTLATCSSHGFFHVDMANLREAESTASQCKTTIHAWINEIKDEYKVMKGLLTEVSRLERTDALSNVD
ncbi:uncharacterized protein Z518_08442 [Rhinocladiella mackenziei CBS 650.93]|uniref:Rhinocladiella mackenziei CBS 650.93 unplaced genomic scaffold supercont1.6, whole genome shotgun sequence n=1 Tax=Rhinocladiella mackenziei CBS 650.93 TaxID=1442369 RepID=A0A0D2IGX0_9EURO|nr:uncharacterized protein Z518_08442 [Rhinocladiella mackenziei CBS 650.93]KIX02501.1 hypothetical protein Z518_08442 [Rhinocladiella mackenziei CBS 650.93]